MPTASRDIHGTNGSARRMRRLRRSDADGDRQLAAHGAHALEHAPRRRHVGVVAADRDADVPVLGQPVVRRIESHPAEIGQQRLDPGVRRAVGRAIASRSLWNR